MSNNNDSGKFFKFKNLQLVRKQNPARQTRQNTDIRTQGTAEEQFAAIAAAARAEALNDIDNILTDDLNYNNISGNPLHDIQKMSIRILLAQGMLPLVSIQHDTPRHRVHGYFRRSCQFGFGGSHVGAFRIRCSTPIAIKDHRLPPRLRHAHYKTLLLQTAADRLAEYSSV